MFTLLLCKVIDTIIPQIIGYARSSMTVQQLADKSNPFMKVSQLDYNLFSIIFLLPFTTTLLLNLPFTTLILLLLLPLTTLLLQAKNKDVLSAFWKQVSYVAGTYDTPDGFIKLNEHIAEIEAKHGGEKR